MRTGTQAGTFIDERRIAEAIERSANPSKEMVSGILSKGRALAVERFSETVVDAQVLGLCARALDARLESRESER